MYMAIINNRVAIVRKNGEQPVLLNNNWKASNGKVFRTEELFNNMFASGSFDKPRFFAYDNQPNTLYVRYLYSDFVYGYGKDYGLIPKNTKELYCRAFNINVSRKGE